MKTLFKYGHLAIIGLFIITGNDFYDYLLGGIIAVIAYIYAFTFTSKAAYTLRYQSTLMSFTHWFIRTIVTVIMIVLSRGVYNTILITESSSSESGNELLAILVCSVIWIIVAEIAKSLTGLRKRYW